MMFVVADGNMMMVKTVMKKMEIRASFDFFVGVSWICALRQGYDTYSVDGVVNHDTGEE